jgi:peptidyl-tRNA hydrolase, PTH1 family
LDRLRRRSGDAEGGDRILVVGLGNPGAEYAGTRHNVGFEVAAELTRRWELPRARKRFRGLITEGRSEPGGPQVAVLLPQTYMNESGSSVGPACGSLKVPLEWVVVLHDEIDLPFGDVRSRLGGGLAGHNGLRSLAEGLGGPDFRRVRIGIGRPESSDPEAVSAYVLGRFREPDDVVRALISAAADEAERVVRSAAEQEAPA